MTTFGPDIFYLQSDWGLLRLLSIGDDHVGVTSPKSQESIWTAQEVLLLFSYMLSPECKEDMTWTPDVKKKGVGSHGRHTYSRMFGANLFVKWIRISARWFLQVDRYQMKDMDGVPTCRARFNKTVVSQLVKADTTLLFRKLGNPAKPPLPDESWSKMLDEVVSLMPRGAPNFRAEHRRLLSRPQPLTSKLLRIAAVMCLDFDISTTPSATELLNDERLELWHTLSQATG